MAIIPPSNFRPLNSTDLEIAVARSFNYRQNLIVPNVFWGLGFKHEIDVLVLTPANYAYEIEIKTAKSDLKRDFLKPHGHRSNRLRKQFFCVTKDLEELALTLILEETPEWGLLVVEEGRDVRTVRYPTINKLARPFTEDERQKLYDLAAMRIWSLKETLACRRR